FIHGMQFEMILPYFKHILGIRTFFPTCSSYNKLDHYNFIIFCYFWIHALKSASLSHVLCKIGELQISKKQAFLQGILNLECKNPNMFDRTISTIFHMEIPVELPHLREDSMFFSSYIEYHLLMDMEIQYMLDFSGPFGTVILDVGSEGVRIHFFMYGHMTMHAALHFNDCMYSTKRIKRLYTFRERERGCTLFVCMQAT
ncbi:hypothetical protein ACJX0J_007284, partial [Zea mays]